MAMWSNIVIEYSHSDVVYGGTLSLTYSENENVRQYRRRFLDIYFENWHNFVQIQAL